MFETENSIIRRMMNKVSYPGLGLSLIWRTFCGSLCPHSSKPRLLWFIGQGVVLYEPADLVSSWGHRDPRSRLPDTWSTSHGSLSPRSSSPWTWRAGSRRERSRWWRSGVPKRTYAGTPLSAPSRGTGSATDTCLSNQWDCKEFLLSDDENTSLIQLTI